MRVSGHSAVVRITHWLTTLSFLALSVSGVAILMSHPRLYWGETGNVETPSLIDLPIDFVLANQNGWGRYLHFQSAWIVVFTGLAYAISGVRTQHFRKDLIPSRHDLSWRSVATAIADHLRLKFRRDDEEPAYNVLQRITYLGVVFVLFPLMIWTGFAMSPSLTSIFPPMVTVLGGQQSARTIHFVAANLLLLFAAGHVLMVVLAGFTKQVGAMIVGRA